ncbi:MAG: RadC family protein [Candidatus Woesearchaeota archaeon]
MKICELSAENKPRERLVQFGVQALSDAELLALILSSGTRKENVLVLAQRILSTMSICTLRQSSVEELMKFSGIGIAKACQLLALGELKHRTKKIISKLKIIGPKEVAEFCQEFIGDAKQEIFMVLHLNTQNEIISKKEVSKGILNSAVIHPREVFSQAIREGAHSIIVCHNHPSGHCEPSSEDIDATKKLIKAGDIVGIKVLDHVIIGKGKKNQWWSYKEKS